MAKVGYICEYSQDQTLEQQITMFNRLEIDKFFCEKISEKSFNRSEFQKLLNWIRAGDCVIIPSLACLGREYEELRQIVVLLQQKNVSLRILEMPSLNIDTIDMFLSIFN